MSLDLVEKYLGEGKGKLSRQAKQIYDNLRDDGFDYGQIKDAMEDGEFLKKSKINQDVAEDIHYYVSKLLKKK